MVTTDGWKVYFDIDQLLKISSKASLTLREVERLNTDVILISEPQHAFTISDR